jgi:hypothetical protein
VRAQPELSRLVAEIGREGMVLRLTGMAPEELAQLAPPVPAADLIARLHRATNGNPLFADELLRLVAASPDAADAVPVPDGVRETLRRRFDLLPASARPLLEAASVLGSSFDARILAEMAGAPLATAVDALGAASSAGLLRAASPEQHVFAHDLMRETLYNDLPAADRMRLHARAAAALELGPDREERAAELAHHLTAAGPASAERAAHWAARAGRRALRLFAFEDAAAFLDRALELATHGPEGETRATVELLIDLGAARTHAGQVKSGQESCRRAAELARRIAAPDLFAQAALGYGAEIAFGQVDPFLVELLEQALAGLGDQDLALRARLMARLASALQPSPTPERPIALAREAIAVARRVGHPPTLAAVLAGARAAFRILEDLDERTAIDAEIVALAEAHGDVVLAQAGHRRQAFNALERGDLAGFDRAVAAFERSIGHVRRAQSGYQLLLLQAARAALGGRFPEAFALVDEAEAAFDRLREPLALRQEPLSWFELQRMLFERARGSRAALERFRASSWGPIDSLIRLDLLVRLGERDQAREALQRAVGDGLPDNLNYLGRVLLSEACIALGEVAPAERLLALLAPLEGRCVVWLGLFCACDGAIARISGGLSALVGRFADAERYFAAALRDNERLGAPAWLARTRFDFARALERRGGPGDAARARDLDAQAAETFAALGMESSLHAERAVPAPRTATVTPQLAREGEYWTLVGAGPPIRLRDSDGLRYIDHLLRHPGVEFHAADLLPLGRRGGDAEAAGSGDAGPLLDREARQAYRHRLEDLRETLSEAEAFNDPVRAERARAEIEHLTAELSRAVGLSGRERRAASAAERARVNVTLRIRNAIKKIEEISPAMAHELGSCIHTGTFCSYTPAPAR